MNWRSKKNFSWLLSSKNSKIFFSSLFNKKSIAQKLQISEFLIKLFSPGPWPLQRPAKTTFSPSATSIGYQIVAEDASFYILFIGLEWKLGGVRQLHFPKWIDSIPTRVFNWPNTPGSLGLNYKCVWPNRFFSNLNVMWRGQCKLPNFIWTTLGNVKSRIDHSQNTIHFYFCFLID